MTDFIAIDIENDEVIAKELASIAKGELRDAAADELSDYLLRVLRHYPSYRRVTRKQAYGVTFFSPQQRRAFFAKLNSGEISVPYKRTQALSKGWHRLGEGEKTLIANEVPHAKFAYGDPKQANLLRLIGWKTLPEIIRERIAEGMRRADAAVKKRIKRAGL